MAIYHCSVKVISRNTGRSAVGAAAYRSGEKITNERDGEIHDYRKKGGVVHSEILTPENAPEIFKDRSTLWNEVEKSETRSNSRTAREVEVALPNEFTREQQIEILREYVQKNFVDNGMVADISIHDKGDGNPHAHVLLTTREVSPDGFGKKVREWDNRENVMKWRENWAATCNKEFERQKMPERIDHRSYAEQGIVKEPMVHLGKTANNLEKRGIQTDRGNINREVGKENMVFENDLKEFEKMVEELKRQPTQEEKRIEPPTQRPPAAAELRTEVPPTEPQPTPEQIAKSMHDLETRYNTIGKQLDSYRENVSKFESDIRITQGAVNDLTSKSNTLHSFDEQISKLTEKRNQLGIFDGKEKRSIDEQIERINKSKQQLQNNIRQTYHIEPGRTDIAINTLNASISKLNERRAVELPQINSLKQQQQLIEHAYKKSLVMSEVSPNKEEIQKELKKEVSKQEIGKPLTLQERLEKAQSEQRLNRISNKDIEKISKGMKPEQASALNELLKKATQKNEEKNR